MRLRSGAMPQTLDDFMQELEEETRRAGPVAVARAEALKARYTLAADLIALRKRRGLTLRQLSTRAGIEQGEISRIEGGRADPTLQMLTVLARQLGAEIRLVTGGTRAAKGPGGSARRTPSRGRRATASSSRRQ